MRLPLGPLALLSLVGLFLLPFMDFSCQGRSVMTLTGYEAAFGKTISADLPVGDWLEGGKSRNNSEEGRFKLSLSQKDKVQGRPLFAAALIISVAGAALAFVRSSLGAWAGLAVCVLLLVAQSDVQKEMQQQQVPLVVLSFLPAFWASLAAAGAGGVLCLMGRK